MNSTRLMVESLERAFDNRIMVANESRTDTYPSRTPSRMGVMLMPDTEAFYLSFLLEDKDGNKDWCCEGR